jgi:hypothetical protein
MFRVQPSPIPILSSRERPTQGDPVAVFRAFADAVEERLAGRSVEPKVRVAAADGSAVRR